MAKQKFFGTAGNDTIDLTGRERALGAGFDGFEVFAGDGADRVIGSALHDILRGEAGDDILEGGKGNDILLGGAGNDTLDGGEGIDTVSYAGQAGFVAVDLAAGTGTIASFLPSILPGERDTIENVENATAGDGGSRLAGNAFNNILTGGLGSDLLIGGGGNDMLIGGAGVDTASYAGQTMFVDVNLANGTGKVVSAANLVVEQDTLSGIENAVAGNGGSRLIGDGADNRLIGGAGRDNLQGAAGRDTLIGGADRDTLDGGENDDVLLGGLGSDAIIGGGGSDTVSYAGQSGFANVDLATGSGRIMLGIAHTELDTLTGIENATAGDDGSRLQGNAERNVLTGGRGADLLIGGGGGDTLIGGDGVDTVSYAGQQFFVDVNLATGIGKIVSSAGLVVEQDTLAGIENLIAGDAGSRLVGNAADNVFTSGAGNDALDGAEGSDTVSYAGRGFFVEVDLTAGTGSVIAPNNLLLDKDALSRIENVVAGDAGSRILGDGADNILVGGKKTDDLRGGSGRDTLDGGFGNDTLDGGQGIDTLSYAGRTAYVQVDLNISETNVTDDFIFVEHDHISGFENVVAGDGGSLVIGDANANVLTGGAGSDLLIGDIPAQQGAAGNADTLIGNGGADMLRGGYGDDILTGGQGADTFAYGHNSFDYSPLLGTDRITDFAVAGPDRDVMALIHPVYTGADFSGTVADAIAQGYIYWAASELGTGTTVFVDYDGGGQDGVAVFELDGVAADQLSALHFTFQ